jgi:hypothetical protein
MVLVSFGLLRFLVWALRWLMAGQQIVEVIVAPSSYLRALSKIVVDQLLCEIWLALHQIVAYALHGLR